MFSLSYWKWYRIPLFFQVWNHDNTSELEMKTLSLKVESTWFFYVCVTYSNILIIEHIPIFLNVLAFLWNCSWIQTKQHQFSCQSDIIIPCTASAVPGQNMQHNRPDLMPLNQMSTYTTQASLELICVPEGQKVHSTHTL